MKNKILLIILLTLLPLMVLGVVNSWQKKTISLPPENLVQDDLVMGVKDQKIVVNNIQEDKKEGKLMNKTQTTQPAMTIEANKNYLATIHTSYGDIAVQLDAKNTPLATNNFVNLAKMGFYNDTIFHRVIADFMIQGGDPLGNGTGGPSYTFADELSPNQLVKGSLAMANRGPNTNGSQFFIVTAEATSWLDGKHTNFGQVIDGMDVVEKIANTTTGANDKPVSDIVIQSIDITEK